MHIYGGCGQELSLSQVDGIEYDKVGLDLYEMADVLLAMGVYQAVVSSHHTAQLSQSPAFHSNVYINMLLCFCYCSQHGELSSLLSRTLTTVCVCLSISTTLSCPHVLYVLGLGMTPLLSSHPP